MTISLLFRLDASVGETTDRQTMDTPLNDMVVDHDDDDADDYDAVATTTNDATARPTTAKWAMEKDERTGRKETMGNDDLLEQDDDQEIDEPDEDDLDEQPPDTEESRLLDAAADFIVLVRDGDLETLREGVESFGAEKASRACTAIETRLGGLTAMTLAAELGHEEIIRLFIEAGADVNGKNATGCWTPLHCAVSQGFPKVSAFFFRHISDTFISVEFVFLYLSSIVSHRT